LLDDLLGKFLFDSAISLRIPASPILPIAIGHGNKDLQEVMAAIFILSPEVFYPAGLF
jgi:hypothetical protein